MSCTFLLQKKIAHLSICNNKIIHIQCNTYAQVAAEKTKTGVVNWCVHYYFAFKFTLTKIKKVTFPFYFAMTARNKSFCIKYPKNADHDQASRL